MKIVAKPAKPIPSGIFKRAAQVPQPFALFIMLDDYPYCEIAERTEAHFNAALEGWKRGGNLEALRKSNVRYFARGKDLAIKEVKP